MAETVKRSGPDIRINPIGKRSVGAKVRSNLISKKGKAADIDSALQTQNISSPGPSLSNRRKYVEESRSALPEIVNSSQGRINLAAS